MIVLDTSAVLAILHEEPKADGFLAAIAAHMQVLISAGTLVELMIVADNRDSLASGERLDRFLDRIADRLQVVPVTREQANIARQAYRRFGKGNHPAALDFGDCFAYALASESGAPLLFKGDDFRLTDVFVAA